MTISEAWLIRRLERSFLVGGVALLSLACGKATVGSSGGCCNDEEWTTSAEVAKAYAGEESTETLGCPSKIERGEKPPANLPPDAGEPPHSSLDFVEAKTKTLRASGDTSSCVYHSVTCCPGGRPLFAANEDRPVIAARARGARWSKKALAPLGTTLDPAMRAGVARGWLEDAFAEHASVASFARASLELLAVGAPPSLLAAHQRAGLQEVWHAERCFALARAYGGDAIDPGPLAIPLPRAGGLPRLASDLLVEGCIAETIGALLASRALEDCSAGPVRDALQVIAAEEAAHAALAWKTLAWAIEEGGADVVRAVLDRARGSRPLRAVARPAVDLRSHGRLAEADIARATDDAWRLVIDPLLAKLQS